VADKTSGIVAGETHGLYKADGDDKALHFGLYVKGQLTSVISCFEDQDEMQFRKFATLIDRQNQGFGTCLLNYIIDEARRRGVKRLWCSARSDKCGFYEKLGLATTGNRFVRDRMEYVTMEMRFSRDFGSNP
jgi:N-acetylglutamate synthase-like GNAT family acetyltransferase